MVHGSGNSTLCAYPCSGTVTTNAEAVQAVVRNAARMTFHDVSNIAVNVNYLEAGSVKPPGAGASHGDLSLQIFLRAAMDPADHPGHGGRQDPQLNRPLQHRRRERNLRQERTRAGDDDRAAFAGTVCDWSSGFQHRYGEPVCASPDRAKRRQRSLHRGAMDMMVDAESNTSATSPWALGFPVPPSLTRPLPIRFHQRISGDRPGGRHSFEQCGDQFPFGCGLP